MKSLRLKTIASFVSLEDCVVDVGCDHAYLAIDLIEKQMCQKVLATDIHIGALTNAQNNITKHGLDKKIFTVLSDGLSKVNQEDFNTIILAGMGTSTILHILKKVSKKYIKKIIIQSNNDLCLLRISMLKKGYFLEREKVVYEKGHYYVAGCYVRKFHFLDLRTCLFGKYDKENLSYYNDLASKYELIYSKIQHWSWKKIQLFFKRRLLKKYL